MRSNSSWHKYYIPLLLFRLVCPSCPNREMSVAASEHRALHQHLPLHANGVSVKNQPSVSTTERWRSTKFRTVHYSPIAPAATVTVIASLQIPLSPPTALPWYTLLILDLHSVLSDTDREKKKEEEPDVKREGGEGMSSTTCVTQWGRRSGNCLLWLNMWLVCASCHTCQAGARTGRMGSWCLWRCTGTRLLRRLSHEPHSDGPPSITPPYIVRCVRDATADVAPSRSPGHVVIHLNGPTTERRAHWLRGGLWENKPPFCTFLSWEYKQSLVTALVLLWANYRNPLLWQYMKHETSFSCRQGRWWQWDSNQGGWQCSHLTADSRTFIINTGKKILAPMQGCSFGSNGWKTFCLVIHSKGAYQVYLLCKEELPCHYISWEKMLLYRYGICFCCQHSLMYTSCSRSNSNIIIIFLK